MSDNTALNPGTGGDTIATEDLGAVKMPVTKLHTGAANIDGGPVQEGNPFATHDARVLEKLDEIAELLSDIRDALT